MTFSVSMIIGLFLVGVIIGALLYNNELIKEELKEEGWDIIEFK